MPGAVEGLWIPVFSLGQVIKRLFAAVLEHIDVILEPLEVTVAHPTII